MIDFHIPIRTPTFNELLRMHFTRRKKELKLIAWHVRVAAGAPPAQPFKRARVTIHRYTPRALDEDGKGGIAKGILDVLQPCSRKHPLGLGYIAGDDPEHLELAVLIVKSMKVATRIIIEELE